MGRGKNTTASYIETDGAFITKPQDIANYFNNYFTSKIQILRNAMRATEDMEPQTIIKDYIMMGKRCMFKFHNVEKQYVEKCLLAVADDKSPGTVT